MYVCMHGVCIEFCLYAALEKTLLDRLPSKPQQTYQLGQINTRYWFKTFQSKFPVWPKTSKYRFVLRNGFKDFIELIQKLIQKHRRAISRPNASLMCIREDKLHLVKIHTACLLICIKTFALANALFNMTNNFRKANTYII